jgi:serine/threonine protein kinase
MFCFENLKQVTSLPRFHSITGTAAISTTYGERNSIKQVNQYILLGAIGQGAFSRVFVARDSNTGRLYALKRVHLRQLSKSSIGVRSILREIELMSRISHPNIVTLHEAILVKENQVVYLVLDYAACGNLAQIIKKGVALSVSALRHIFRQVAEGVAYLHGNGIVHQDLKEHNVLVDANGVALISDFGSGHSFHSSARGFGTPAYQAPELVNSTARDAVVHPGKEDVWSLGVMLHHLIFGYLPFDGADVFELAKVATAKQIVRPAGADDWLWDLIVRMLRPDPAVRIGIDAVLEHPWVKNVSEVCIEVPVPDLPAIDESLPVNAVRGDRVTAETTLEEFAVSKKNAGVSHFDAPFPFERIATYC